MSYGCKYSLPHDLKHQHETKGYKWEICLRCGKKMKWKKDHRGRVHNVNYLKAHVRNFAQRNGATKRVYHKVYKRDKCKIVI